MPTESVPGRTLREATIEHMEEGELYPDQLSDVISRADEDKQRQAQGEEHYLGLHPDMTIRRKTKRFTGTVPKEREDVRDKYVIARQRVAHAVLAESFASFAAELHA